MSELDELWPRTFDQVMECAKQRGEATLTVLLLLNFIEYSKKKLGIPRGRLRLRIPDLPVLPVNALIASEIGLDEHALRSIKPTSKSRSIDLLKRKYIRPECRSILKDALTLFDLSLIHPWQVTEDMESLEDLLSHLMGTQTILLPDITLKAGRGNLVFCIEREDDADLWQRPFGMHQVSAWFYVENEEVMEVLGSLHYCTCDLSEVAERDFISLMGDYSEEDADFARKVLQEIEDGRLPVKHFSEIYRGKKPSELSVVLNWGLTWSEEGQNELATLDDVEAITYLFERNFQDLRDFIVERDFYDVKPITENLTNPLFRAWNSRTPLKMVACQSHLDLIMTVFLNRMKSKKEGQIDGSEEEWDEDTDEMIEQIEQDHAFFDALIKRKQKTATRIDYRMLTCHE